MSEWCRLLAEQFDLGLQCSLFLTHPVGTLMYVKTTLLKGPGSTGPIFGLKTFENLKLFTVIEFCSQYEDIILLYVKTCFKTLIIHLALPWERWWMGCNRGFV